MSNITRVMVGTSIATILGFTLACTGGASTTVEGERAAADGLCPEDETCSEKAPDGLLFQGQMLYDEGADRLGPVLVGGRFDLRFFSQGYELDGYILEIDGISLESAAEYEGPARVELWGLEPGMATIRVLDPDTGALYDRLTLQTVQIDDIELHNVVEEERETLKGGCEEMIGLRLVAEGGTLRAFDQNVKVTSPSDVVPDPFVWDCFRYVVPDDVSEVSFEIEAGGEIWIRTMDVEPLADGDACPVLSD